MTHLERNNADALPINLAAALVTVRWGGEIIHTKRLGPIRNFTLGADFAVSAAQLGCDSSPLIVLDERRRPFVVVPACAPSSVEDAHGNVNELPPSLEARQVSLVAGHTVTVRYGELSFTVSGEGKEQRFFSIERPGRGLAAVVLTAMCTFGFVGATYAVTPPLTLTENDTPTEEQRYLMNAYLDGIAEQEKADQELALNDNPAVDGPDSPNPGKADADAKQTGPSRGHGNDRYYGPKERSAPTTRGDLVEDARRFGMIDLIDQQTGGVPTPAGWDTSGDPFSMPEGISMWHDGPGVPGGPLNLTDPGGEGSHTATNWYTNPFPNTSPWEGFDGNRQLKPWKRDPHAPDLRQDEGFDQDGGVIPAQVIQRIIRANFGRFRGCYDAGLRSNPALAGRVSTRILIGRDGSVLSAANGGSDLPDAAVVNCVVANFRGLRFPAPGRGTVSVTYPIMFVPPSS